MADLPRSVGSEKTVFEPKEDFDNKEETDTTSDHLSARVATIQPSLTGNEVEETLSKRKRKRMLKHEQWLQRKEQRK